MDGEFSCVVVLSIGSIQPATRKAYYLFTNTPLARIAWTNILGGKHTGILDTFHRGILLCRDATVESPEGWLKF